VRLGSGLADAGAVQPPSRAAPRAVFYQAWSQPQCGQLTLVETLALNT
jgi:hypothetical protein